MRPDVTGTDVVLLMCAPVHVIEYLPNPAPDLWRRYLAIIFDGLRPEGANPLPTHPRPGPDLEAANPSKMRRPDGGGVPLTYAACERRRRPIRPSAGADEIRRIDELITAPRGPAAAARWSCAARRASARARCWTTPGRRRPGSGSCDASGAEFEAELPFAALHQLCVPVLEQLPTLPAPHRDALRVAFGLATGAPDPFRIGLAALELLAAAARERPLLCLVDDAQWLDAASSKAMAFLARRIAAEPVAVRVRGPVPRSAGAASWTSCPGLPSRG